MDEVLSGPVLPRGLTSSQKPRRSGQVIVSSLPSAASVSPDTVLKTRPCTSARRTQRPVLISPGPPFSNDHAPPAWQV